MNRTLGNTAMTSAEVRTLASNFSELNIAEVDDSKVRVYPSLLNMKDKMLSSVLLYRICSQQSHGRGTASPRCIIIPKSVLVPGLAMGSQPPLKRSRNSHSVYGPIKQSVSKKCPTSVG